MKKILTLLFNISCLKTMEQATILPELPDEIVSYILTMWVKNTSTLGALATEKLFEHPRLENCLLAGDGKKVVVNTDEDMVIINCPVAADDAPRIKIIPSTRACGVSFDGDGILLLTKEKIQVFDSMYFDPMYREYLYDAKQDIKTLTAFRSLDVSIEAHNDMVKIKDDTTFLQKIKEKSIVNLVEIVGQEVRSFDFTPDGKTGVVAVSDDHLHIAKNFQLMNSWQLEKPFTSVSIAPAGDELLIAFTDGTVALYDVDIMVLKKDISFKDKVSCPIAHICKEGDWINKKLIMVRPEDNGLSFFILLNSKMRGLISLYFEKPMPIVAWSDAGEKLLMHAHHKVSMIHLDEIKSLLQHITPQQVLFLEQYFQARQESKLSLVQRKESTLLRKRQGLLTFAGLLKYLKIAAYKQPPVIPPVCLRKIRSWIKQVRDPMAKVS